MIVGKAPVSPVQLQTLSLGLGKLSLQTVLVRAQSAMLEEKAVMEYIRATGWKIQLASKTAIWS